jgi:hypothetical protein
MRLDEKLSREKPIRVFWPKPVLTEPQWEIYQLLRERFLPGRWQLFAGSLLSHFFDPDDFKHDQHRYSLVKRTPVLFAVATEAPECRAVLIILAQPNVTVEAFLTEESVHWMLLATQLNSDEFVDQVSVALLNGSRKPIGTRTPISDSENKSAHAVRTGRMIDRIRVHNLEQYLENGISTAEARRHLINRSPCLLHEVALQVMEPRYPLPWTDFEKSMLQTSSVDLLLHDRGSLNRPLLAIEIDGRIHQAAAQHEKDKVKDELLKGMGIPLIRISVEDARYLWTEQEAQKHGEKLSPAKQRQLEDELRHFGGFFGHIVGLICSQVRLQSGEEIKLQEANISLAKIEEVLSRTHFGKGYVDLDDKQRDWLHKLSHESNQADAYCDASRDYAYLVEQKLQHAKECSAWPVDLQEITTPPELVGDAISGLRARTLLTTPRRVTIPVESPVVKLMASSLDPDLLDAHVKQALIGCLVEKARDYLKGHVS